MINKELQRREYVDANYKSKKENETNPVKSCEFLLYDLTHFSTPIKLMLCLLRLEYLVKAHENSRAFLDQR